MKPPPEEKCLRCNLPLDAEERERSFDRFPTPARLWWTCELCGLRATGKGSPVALGKLATPTQLHLFDVDPEEKCGIAIACDPERNVVQIAVWESHLVRRMIRTMTFRDFVHATGLTPENVARARRRPVPEGHRRPWKKGRWAPH